MKPNIVWKCGCQWLYFLNKETKQPLMKLVKVGTKCNKKSSPLDGRLQVDPKLMVVGQTVEIADKKFLP